MSALCPIGGSLHLPRRAAWLVVMLGLGHTTITPAAAGTIYWNMQTPAATSNDVAGGGIQFRLYGSGGTALNLNNTTWRIDDLQVIVVPEPAGAGFTILLAAGLAVALRRARNATVRSAEVRPRSRT